MVKIQRECSFKMKEADKKKDQKMWEFWAAKREGMWLAKKILSDSIKRANILANKTQNTITN